MNYTVDGAVLSCIEQLFVHVSLQLIASLQLHSHILRTSYVKVDGTVAYMQALTSLLCKVSVQTSSVLACNIQTRLNSYQPFKAACFHFACHAAQSIGLHHVKASMASTNASCMILHQKERLQHQLSSRELMSPKAAKLASQSDSWLCNTK